MQPHNIHADIPVPEGWELASVNAGSSSRDGLVRFRIKRDEGSTIVSGPRAPVIAGYECYFVGHSPTWTSYSYVEVKP